MVKGASEVLRISPHGLRWWTQKTGDPNASKPQSPRLPRRSRCPCGFGEAELVLMRAYFTLPEMKILHFFVLVVHKKFSEKSALSLQRVAHVAPTKSKGSGFYAGSPPGNRPQKNGTLSPNHSPGTRQGNSWMSGTVFYRCHLRKGTLQNKHIYLWLSKKWGIPQNGKCYVLQKNRVE